MPNVYEIHKYQNDAFQYVVARTSKLSEEKVKKDIEHLNSILNEVHKSEGFRYIFAIGTMIDLIKNNHKKKKDNRGGIWG